MSSLRLDRVEPPAVLRVEAPPSPWSTIVSLAVAAASGGAIVQGAGGLGLRIGAALLEKLGYVIEERGEGAVRVAAGERRAGGEIVVNVGCSYDFAVFAGIVAGALAPPGARVALRVCQDLLEADWRPLVESVVAYGGRAWVTGIPSRAVIVEAPGLGRLSSSLWNISVSKETSAHIAALLVAAVAAGRRVYIRVRPRDPPAKTDIDDAVAAVSQVASIEYSANYTRFVVDAGSSDNEVEVRLDAPLALHLAGFAALGSRVELRVGGGPETPFDPLSVSKRLLELTGYNVDVDGDTLIVSKGGVMLQHRLFMYDEPGYAASALTLAAARMEELAIEELTKGYMGDVENVAGALASLGYSVELGEGRVAVKPPREEAPQPVQEVIPVVTCTSPHVLPAVLVAAAARRAKVVVERWECLRGVWPGFYRIVEEVGVSAHTG